MPHSGFELQSTTPVDSLGVALTEYVHARTGARHFHLESADSNNAFMVAVPTLPEDSTGVAHILEHTTLCGSERYPVRDPFFMMLRRSLNTFMNAFTSGDSTAYPFATQNPKDFDNLLSVYLDAVFFPRLDPLDFAQEGWRLEARDAEHGPELEYHGVVYNEMKGAMSSPVAQLWQHLHAALFPDTVYRHNSGGDPLAIPALSYEALRDFHARHYRPANVVFMTYGNLSAAQHQQRFASLVLDRFDDGGTPVVALPQPTFDAPRYVEARYDHDDEASRETHIVWGWVIGDSTDPGMLVEAHFLSSLLLEHGASPLRHYLETTELANGPSELCGVDDSTRQLVFLCGVEGSDPEHANALESGVLDVLSRVIASPPAAAELDAMVDALELAQRDIGSGSYPFGLQLMGRVLPAAVYRGDPGALLDLDPPLAKLRRAVHEPGYVAGLARRLLVDNPHRVRVVMAPDAGKAEAERAEEQHRLERLRRELDAGGIERLRAQAAALEARQASVDDPDVLPRVTLEDVPPPAAAPRGAARSLDGADADLVTYECATNGIVRAQLVIELPSLDAAEQRALPLLCEYLAELGQDDQDYLAVQTRRARTGSFSVHAMARAPIEAREGLAGWLVVAGKGLARKRDALIAETLGLLGGVRFDERDRVRELLLQSRAEAEQSVTDRGHQLAILAASRTLSPGAALDDAWDGPSAVRYLQQFGPLASADAGVDALLARFADIRAKLQAAPRRVLLIGEADALAGAEHVCREALPERSGSFVRLSDTAFDAGTLDRDLGDAATVNAWLTGAQVNFCAKAYVAPAESSPDAPLLAVLGRYLQDGFLHGEIREKGGAYGSGAGYDPDAGTFRFFSYRDPRAAATFADFDRSLEWFAGDRDPRRLEESILGTVRALDQPRTPAGEAERAFFNGLYGRDDAFRCAFREQVLGATHAALRDVADRYLEPARGRLGAIAGSADRGAFERLGMRLGKL